MFAASMLRRSARRLRPAALGAAAAAAGAWALQSEYRVAASDAAPPSTEPVSEEVVPTKLHLISAQVLFRHGHRTPVHVHHTIDHTEGWAAGPRLPSEAVSVTMVDANVRRARARGAGTEGAGSLNGGAGGRGGSGTARCGG